MGENEIILSDAIRVLSVEEEMGLLTHPSAEELLAYQAGRIDGAETQRLRTHLAACRECTRTILDLASFPEIELHASGHDRTADEEAADWQLLEERLSATSLGAPNHSRPVGVLAEKREARPFPEMQIDGLRFPEKARRIPFWFQAVAATLVMVTAGLLLWIADLNRRLVDLGRQQAELPSILANFHFQELQPAGESRTRTREPGSRVSVPPGMDNVLLFFSVKDFRSFEDYGVEVFDGAGELRWRRAGLVRTPEGAFAIGFPRSMLPAASYRFKLYGVRDSELLPLATYEVTFEYL